MTEPPTVSLCIPAYRAEGFIGRTLDCARVQSHQDVLINVSIDGSHDRTEEICRQASTEDERIRVSIQRGGLGWSRNTNAALAMARTDHVGVYFHDDIIEPTYVEHLVDALGARPAAASAHCDLAEFGLVEGVQPAHDYDGSTLHRIVDFLTTRRGTTLRSLHRRSRTGDLRFPTIHGDNHWSAYVFHVALLAAGPSVAVHEPLYRRWQREGSLTRSGGWFPGTLDDLLRGQAESFDATVEVLRQRLPDRDERCVATQALVVFHRTVVRRMQVRLGNRDALPDRLDWDGDTDIRADIGDETRDLLVRAERQLLELEARAA